MKSHLRFASVVLFGTLLDLISKSVVFSWLDYPSSKVVTLISGLFDFRCAINRGGVFGVFQSFGFIFIPLSVFALGFIVWFYLSIYKHTPRFTLPLALVLAGTLGNLYDRVFHGVKLFHGSVRDFIDVHVGSYIWPTFNVADIWICMGSGLLILYLATEKGEEMTKYPKTQIPKK